MHCLILTWYNLTDDFEIPIRALAVRLRFGVRRRPVPDGRRTGANVLQMRGDEPQRNPSPPKSFGFQLAGLP